MAKKALVIKASKTPKFEVRGYTRCQKCGRPRAVLRKFGLLPHLRARDGARRRAAGRHEELLVSSNNSTS